MYQTKVIEYTTNLELESKLNQILTTFDVCIDSINVSQLNDKFIAVVVFKIRNKDWILWYNDWATTHFYSKIII